MILEVSDSWLQWTIQLASPGLAGVFGYPSQRRAELPALHLYHFL